MTIENQLKNLICDKYGSMRNFARKIEISQSTLATILRRGVQNASISTVIKICNALDISVDALAVGEILPKADQKQIEYTDMDYIFNYMLVDGKELSPFEKHNLKTMFINDIDLIKQNRQILEKSVLLFKSGKGFIAFDQRTGESVNLLGNEIEKFMSEMADEGVDPQDIVIMSNTKKGTQVCMEMMSHKKNERDKS